MKEKSIIKKIEKLENSLAKPVWSNAWDIAYKHGKIDAYKEIIDGNKFANMDAIIKRALNKLKIECKFGVKPRSKNGRKEKS